MSLSVFTRSARLVSSRVPHFRSAVFKPSAFAVARRSYAADAAEPHDAANQLCFTFACPHDVIANKKVVQSVLVPASTGQFAVYPQHVKTVAELTPGVVAVTDDAGKTDKFFVSGGFAVVHDNSVLNISTEEAVPLDQLDPVAIKDGLDEANRVRTVQSKG